jgi:ubiquinone/menaquinone biosynthesis C-methylase UbiE
MKCLDIGCGSGGFTEIQNGKRTTAASWLELHGDSDSVGVDIDEKLIEKAKQRITNGTRFLAADARNLPFEDNSFDYIHMSGVLHHMSQYETAIREMARVLKSGGGLYLMESVDNNPVFALTRRAIGKWDHVNVESYFKTDELISELSQYFQINKQNYYWRSTVSDIASYFGREPRVSLIANQKANIVINRVGLGKAMCCHFVIEATKK